MYKVIVTRQDGTYAESMSFPALEDAQLWAYWQEKYMKRVAQIVTA